MKWPDHQGGWCVHQKSSKLMKAEMAWHRQARCIHAAVLAPTHASPFAVHSFTRMNPSAAVLLASSAAPEHMFARFPATLPARAFAPPSAAAPRIAYAATPPGKHSGLK